VARHLGSRSHNAAAVYLYDVWLPQSGELPGDFPMFFHYVNVGQGVQEHEMITDVYLPLRRR
jgi:AraC family transcriptional regulator